MADTDGLYTLKINGEKGTYYLRGTEQHGLRPLCDMLSDLTGYKSVYLADVTLARMRIGDMRYVNPADRGSWRGVPTFAVTRVA